MLKCRCDSSACGGKGCPCSKVGSLCTSACHMGKPWESVPCLNTEEGIRVKAMKAPDVRRALCDSGLSPVGDKAELLKRLAIHFTKLVANTKVKDSGGESTNGTSGGEEKDDAKHELMKAIIANEGDYVFVLSLSGTLVSKNSSKADLRRAYLKVSTRVHPDKNPGNQEATKAFQILVESFEKLANPEQYENDDDEPTKTRQKTERFTRDNKGCYATVIKCPRCHGVWNTNDLGLEDAAYNFLMQGIKQFICGGCFAKFGCMTAIHLCPFCRKPFEYDPDDYHRKISCGSSKCIKEGKVFGFMMFKVSEKREKEVRKEVKEENEALAKKRAQQKRRNARFDKRDAGDVQDEEGRVKEQLFLLKLLDNCPRCGWFLERGLKLEDAQAHLSGCTDKEAIAAHKATLAKQEANMKRKREAEESQEDVLAHKTWEINGRQVGQLWMLSEIVLKKECVKLSLGTDGDKVELITRLGRTMRERERKMLTMEGGPGHTTSYDITPIHKVDDEDLPSNLESLEREELACVAASYGVDFCVKADVKSDLVRKLERARVKGQGLLAIAMDIEAQEKEDESDEDYVLDQDSE